MLPSAQSPWVVLRWRRRGDWYWLTYEDSAGVRIKPPRRAFSRSDEWRVADVPGALAGENAVPILVPVMLGEHLHARRAALPDLQEGPHATGPVPLGIFVQSRPDLPEPDGEALAMGILAGEMDPQRFQVARLRHRPWMRRRPFRLPFRVLVADDAGLGAADALESMGWLGNDVVRRYGLRIDVRHLGEPLSAALRTEAYDIVIVEGGEPAMRMLARGMPRGERRPRLIVSLEPGPLAPSVPVPADVSVLRVPGADTTAWTVDFILGLVHDQPLHEAVRSAMRTRGQTLAGEPVLIADPLGNQSLRLSDARHELRDEVTRMRIKSAPYVQGRRKRGRSGADSDRLVARMESATGDADSAITEAMGESLRAAFDQETSGLYPMSYAEAALDRARRAQREMLEALAPPPPARSEPPARPTRGGPPETPTRRGPPARPTRRGRPDTSRRSSPAPPTRRGRPGAAVPEDDMERGEVPEAAAPDALEPEDGRRVDVAMERPIAPGVFEPIGPEAPLSTGAAYRLRVHIGARLPESLVEGEVPAIDPLLPAPDDDRGHDLEVVVFPKRFTLLSPAVQPLRLPVGDSSDPVFFSVRAPEEPGEAELRISVYHRDHMVQSFLLTAPVGQPSSVGPDRVHVRLDFAATERLVEGELSLLRERALCVGVNQDGGGGSHSFMVKRSGTAEGFSLTEQVVKEQVAAFRTLLEDATFKPPIVAGKEKPRFSTYPDPGAEANPAFLAYVRQLADFGRTLYDLLTARVTDSVLTQLRALAAESDRVIQVVRHDANMAFPWGIVYDYPLGLAVAGAPPRPVCLGAPMPELGAPPPSRRRRGCPHNPGHDVYCVDGFWGVRHRLEQRIGKKDHMDTVVRRPAGRPGVMLATGLGDASAAQLAADLGSKLGAELAVLGKDDDLLDLLWDPARRPAVLVVLGHLETRERSGEPRGPRIVLLPKSTWPPPGKVPDEHWLMPAALSEMVQDRGRWTDDPRTLVLLMACSSAATEVGTVNDLVTTLAPVGVAAVVGTETPVFSKLAARFAQEVTLAMWSDGTRTLGEAVQAFNRTLIRSGNPLAFAFTCVGNADLTLAP